MIAILKINSIILCNLVNMHYLLDGLKITQVLMK